MHTAARNLTIALFVAASLVLAPASAPVSAQDGQVVPGQYIVKLAPGLDADSTARELGQLHGLMVQYTYSHGFRGFAAQIPDARLARLQADPRVVSIVPDRYVVISVKPPKPTPTPAPRPAQIVPTGVNRVDADLSPTARIDGVNEKVSVNVAVIDTGIDTGHPDLNVVGGFNCQRSGTYNDGNGHGTHVAGIIGALDNDFGVVGVAPGANLYSVRVLDNRGSGTWSQVICGVDWVTANAAIIAVANMSLGGAGTQGTCSDGGLHEAICQSVAAGVTYVVAAGNEADNAANHVPAAYDEVITVSALADFNGVPGGGAAPTCRVDQDDTFASFSNYGADIDLIAPGVCIYSTYKGGGYATLSGTSMASPHVAGGAALYKATHPGANPLDVKNALVAAGTANWSNADDPDGVQEPLLNVSTF